MSDLISRQAALDIIDSELNGWLTDDERLHLEGVGAGIELLPTIDAVPVVRCKECKYGGLTKKIDCWCERMEMYFKPDFFCADGARSEE